MLSIEEYHSAAEFLKRAETALARNEAMNNLILGVPLRIRQGGAPESSENLFVAVLDGKTIAGAAGMTPPYNLVVHVEPEAEENAPAILDALVEAVSPHREKIPGITGRTPWVDEFVQRWSVRTGREHVVEMNQRIFVLREVVWPRAVEGRLRACIAVDAPLAAQWYNEFLIELMPWDAPGPETARMIEAAIEQQRTYFWEVPDEDGWRAVCLAGKSRALAHGRTVGPIYTPPGERGKGYASNATAALSQLLLDEGWEYATLFTDLSNPTSNSIYQKIGYEPVCDYTAWRAARGTP